MSLFQRGAKRREMGSLTSGLRAIPIRRQGSVASRTLERMGRRSEANAPTATYGTVYGMKKTTVYLPEELKAALERKAAAESRSEAEIIREAIAGKVAARERVVPRIPISSQGLSEPNVAGRVDELLDRFGLR
jgi:predicted transcriptional regulator